MLNIKIIMVGVGAGVGAGGAGGYGFLCSIVTFDNSCGGKLLSNWNKYYAILSLFLLNVTL